MVAMPTKIKEMFTTRLSIPLLCLFFCLRGFAQEQLVTDAAGTGINPAISVVLSVEQNDGDTPVLFDIFTTSSNGLSEGVAPITYLPIRSEFSIDVGGTNFTNDDFNTYANRDKLPRINNGQTTVDHDVFLRYLLNIDRTTLLGRLQVAIKGNEGDGGFVVFKDLGNIPADINSYVAQIGLNEVCGFTSQVDCSPVNNDTSPTNEQTVEFTLHFFLANQQLGNNTAYTPQADNGVFYRVILSSNVYNDRVISLNEVQKGDSQLIVEFEGFIMKNIRSLYAITTDLGVGNCTGPVDLNNQATTVTAGSFDNLLDLETLNFNGQEKIEGLTNGNCYTVRIVQCDFFGFCSFASQQYQETPEEIESLLKKQACFFFTAGFGRQHFIVDYFQEWRNSVLKKFWLGRVFINWYYKTAPQYTPYILKTPWLQKSIQIAAYILYGIIKAWWLAALFVVLAIVHFARRRLSPSKN